MFPESVRDASYNVACATQSSVMGLYGFSRSAFWIIFSSSLILFAPVVVEVERVSIEESQRNQQKQVSASIVFAKFGDSNLCLFSDAVGSEFADAGRRPHAHDNQRALGNGLEALVKT